MFDTENVAVRIAKLEHRQMEKGEKEIQLVDITGEIHPFPRQLAAELDEFVRDTLFTKQDAEMRAKLKGVSFQLPIVPQAIAVRAAPDQAEASYVIDEAKIVSIKARRSKKSEAWRLAFVVRCSPVSEHQLAQIVEGYLKTRYLSFTNATPSLFDDVEKHERRQRRASVTPTHTGPQAVQ